MFVVWVRYINLWFPRFKGMQTMYKNKILHNPAWLFCWSESIVYFVTTSRLKAPGETGSNLTKFATEFRSNVSLIVAKAAGLTQGHSSQTVKSNICK